MKLLLKRGSSKEVDNYTPLKGEVIFDVTREELRVGNGKTLGGVTVSKVVYGPENALYAETPDGFMPMCVPFLKGAVDDNR